MENRQITIDELQPGDEILTLSQCPRYLKVLETPRKSKKGWKWRQGVDRYISVRCKTNITKSFIQRTKWNRLTRTHIPHTYTVKQYNLIPPQNEDDVEKFDLNFHKMWLIKREENGTAIN